MIMTTEQLSFLNAACAKAHRLHEDFVQHIHPDQISMYSCDGMIVRLSERMDGFRYIEAIFPDQNRESLSIKLHEMHSKIYTVDGVA